MRCSMKRLPCLWDGRGGPARRRCVLAGQLRIARIQIWIVQMTFQHALLEAVGHGHVRDATIKGEHAPMRTEPVATLHVLGRPGKEQLAEAKSRDEHISFADLSRLEIHPLDRVASVIDLYAFARLELTRRDSRFPVLRELAVKLLPEIGVSRQMLGFLLPDKLQRMPQPEIVDDRWPLKLQHP